MKTEFCVLVAHPRGSGTLRPIAETIGWTHKKCKECVEEKRIYTPTANWIVGVRYVDDWCSCLEEKK